RVEEVFEKRKPKNPAIVSGFDGVITEIKDTGKEKIITLLPEAGSSKKGAAVEYECHRIRMVLVKVGDNVKKGDVLTDGSVDIDELFKYAGKEKTEQYIISEIKKLYELQGEPVSRKHIEVIVRQMFSRVKVKSAGETSFVTGEVVEMGELLAENDRVKKEGKEEAKAENIVLGITEVSLSRKSFLSAASFQHTTRILIQAAVEGAEDKLTGLMENVILGRLIPAGTGFKGSKKAQMIEDLQRREREEA
ncbi:MAG: DNA-directed polymerase subunit beta, partial [Patescibacteria group bacterium]|nr:DNA-directed polymerase subunit beta [Patescibacteria group bacterium]